MHILLVTETYLPFIAGVSTSTDSIAKFMAACGHTVTIVCPAPILPVTEPQTANITMLTVPSLPDPLYRGKPMAVFPLGFWCVGRELSRGHYDIIHIQEPGSLGITALLCAKFLRIPVVGALHFTPDQVARMMTGTTSRVIEWCMKRYIAFIYNSYQAIMVPTATFSAFLSSVGVKRPITVVSNGVDTTVYTPKPKRGTQKQFSVLYVGRLDQDKNVMVLIDALSHANARVTLTIAGSGKEKDALLSRAKTLGVSDRIRWVGTVSPKEMVSLYHDADCFVLMALYEVQSIVTLQALASGLPVLGARAGALPELIHDGENGYLLDPTDAQGLGEKMSYLAAHPSVCVRMGKESRAISLLHHKPTVLARLEALYRSLVG